MKTVTKRELNQQTAAILAAASAGEPVVVTERGVARWRIDAIDAHPDPVARLRAEGKIIRVSGRTVGSAGFDDSPRRYTPAEVDAVFAKSRDDR